MNRSALVEKINTLYEQGDFEPLLACLEQLMGLDGETEKILDFKFDILMRLERHAEALACALRLEQVALRKSPWHCLKIAESHLGLGHRNEAVAWLERAVVERHFKRWDVFDNKRYDSLKDDQRFFQLIEKARQNIGLQKPVQDFTVSLLGGGEFTLSALKGRVVLIDFWATDCPPCVRDMPSMKNLFAQFKEQGFEIIGISLDTNKTSPEKFVLENGIEWKICCSGKGFGDEIADRFKIESIPSTWLIDKQGILRFYNARGQDLQDAVQLLIGETTSELKCRGDYCSL